jgi:hypothetical protein
LPLLLLKKKYPRRQETSPSKMLQRRSPSIGDLSSILIESTVLTVAEGNYTTPHQSDEDHAPRNKQSTLQFDPILRLRTSTVIKPIPHRVRFP